MADDEGLRTARVLRTITSLPFSDQKLVMGGTLAGLLGVE